MLHSLVFPLCSHPLPWGLGRGTRTKREFSLKGSSPWQSHNESSPCCCPLPPMAQVHRAGEGGTCSNQVAGHKELEEPSQRNSFAHFCFGFLCECFLSALVDEFQTEGMLGNERKKPVTHCMMRQGPAVTHGSWQGSGVHLAFAAPTGPASLTLAVPAHPGCPSTPTAAQHQLQLLCSHQQLGTIPCCPTPQRWHWLGHAKGTCRGFAAEASPLRAAEEVSGKLPGCGSCPAQLVPRATGSCRYWPWCGTGWGGATGPRCIQGNIPPATPIWIIASCFWT